MPIPTVGGNGAGLVPIATVGGSGAGLVPIPTVGGSGAGLVPIATVGGNGAGLVPIATVGGNGAGLVPIPAKVIVAEFVLMPPTLRRIVTLVKTTNNANRIARLRLFTAFLQVEDDYWAESLC